MDNRIIEFESPSEASRECESRGIKYLGDRVEFSVRGTTVERTKAKNAFASAGFAGIIPEPAIEALLTRAAREGKRPKGLIEKPFARPNKDTPIAIGVYRNVAVDGESGDKWQCVYRVRVGFNPGPIAVGMVPENWHGAIDREAQERGDEIASICNRLMESLEASDLGTALRTAATKLGAAQSLGGGNNFFVPSTIAETWHDFAIRVRDELGIFYSRETRTDLFASEVALCQATAQASLEKDILALAEQVKTACEKSSGARSREASLERRVEEHEVLRQKARLYKDLVSSALIERLDTVLKTLDESVHLMLGDQAVDSSIVMSVLDRFDKGTDEEIKVEGTPKESAPKANKAKSSDEPKKRGRPKKTTIETVEEDDEDEKKSSVSPFDAKESEVKRSAELW